MLPPVGSLIVGPCPECEELVAVFAGCVLPLDKEVMFEGSLKDKREHLVSVLNSFIEDRVTRLLQSAEEHEDESSEDLMEGEGAATAVQEPGEAPQMPSASSKELISRCERDNFVEFDLNRLDNKDYFKAIFG